jgi:hypothetical protein
MGEPPGGNLPPPGSPQPPPQQYQPGYGQTSPYGSPYGGIAQAPGAMPAMVLGIISLGALPLACCCGIGEFIVIPLGIVAVVLGFMARSRIAASQGALGGGGKALAGIVTGATAAAIGIVLIVAIFVFGFVAPSLTNAIPTPSG